MLLPGMFLLSAFSSPTLALFLPCASLVHPLGRFSIELRGLACILVGLGRGL